MTNDECRMTNYWYWPFRYRHSHSSSTGQVVSHAHVLAFVSAPQCSVMNESVEHDPARREAKTEEASRFGDVQTQPWHFPVRPLDHRDELFARSFSGDGVAGA
jgi:hypothetical protein